MAFAPEATAALPTETFNCGDDVDHSVKLGDDVGTFAAGCPEDGLSITKDGVTLDLNGHTIWGNRTDDDGGLTESGVIVGGRREVRVVGGTVRGFEVGLLSSAAPKLVVRGVTFADHTQLGALVSGRDARVERNAVTAVTATGLAIFSDFGVVNGNTVTEVDGEGISLVGVKTFVTSNTVTNAGDNGIDLNGSNSTIKGNVVARNAGNGIDLIGSGTVGGNRSLTNAGDGIFAFATDPLRVAGNKVIDNDGEGIFVDGDDVTIAENVVSANEQDGIQINGDDAVLRSNRTHGNLGSGLESDGLRAAFEANQATANLLSGIHVADGTATAGGNRTTGNGFGTFDSIGPGIDATGAAITVTGKNIARANDDPTCIPSSACADEHTDLPLETHGCGDVITESFRLEASIGSMLSRCGGHGLVIAGNDITVDLGGFAIWGSTDGVGDDAGILLTGKGSRVFGGRIAGFEDGVRAEKGTVFDVLVTGAQRTGFVSSPGARLASVAAVENDDDGFAANGGLSSGVSHANAGIGIRTGAEGPGRVKDSVASLNNGDGVRVLGPDGSVKGTTSIRNDEIGIETRGNDSLIANSASVDNGLSGVFSGISAVGARSIVRGNVSSRNSGVGIGITGKDSVVEKNHSVDNDNNGISLGSPATGTQATGNVSIDNGFHGILANAKSVLRANRVVFNDSGGIQVGVNGVEVVNNRAIGNPFVGIETGAVNTSIDGNRATANGFSVPNESGLGIDASAAVKVTGSNVAFGNDDPAGCAPAKLC